VTISPLAIAITSKKIATQPIRNTELPSRLRRMCWLPSFFWRRPAPNPKRPAEVCAVWPDRRPAFDAHHSENRRIRPDGLELSGQPVDALENIDLLERNGESFFRKKYTHAARIGVRVCSRRFSFDPFEFGFSPAEQRHDI
jgi:hypothetical protein